MAGELTYELDLRRYRRVDRAMRGILGHGGKLAVPAKRLAAYKLAEVHRAFKQGGLPEDRWEPLKESTIQGRALRRRGRGRTNPRRILQDRGDLVRHNRAETERYAGGHGVRVFNRHRLARIHNEGAVIPPRVIRARAGGTLRYYDPRTGRIAFAKQTRPGPTVIPARPFIKIYARNIRKGIELIEQYEREVMRREVGPIGRVS